MTLRSQVVLSIFKRNFSSYFSGVLGYLFIIVFVVAGAALAFNAEFFTSNVPTLDQLTEGFPLLLLFLVPAITMTAWADERKLGTDELLFTLPVTDVEVLLGKYLAVVAVYSVSLVFSLAYVVVLESLGDPDWGLLFTTYFGYWLAGSAMLSAGMLASVLTNAPTVAFILGVVIAGIPVFFAYVGRLIEIVVSFLEGIGVLGIFGVGDGTAVKFNSVRQMFSELSLQEQFRDFGLGVIPLSGVLYFVAFTVLMLYLNLVFITKRHWSAGQTVGTGIHYSVRSACLAVIVMCCTAWAGYAAVRVDATAEQLFSLSPSTEAVLDEIESDRPIEIQAFLSPEVPSEYVDTRRSLVGLLRQFDQIGGSNIEVRYVNVEEFSTEAAEAEHFGIQPVRLLSEIEGRRTEVEIYLGAVVISSYDKVVVPFFGKGLPIEYELTRSIRTVATEDRHKVGILTTDANVLNFSQEWQIVTELKKQYNVEAVSADSPIDAESFDVLMAVMPSSLTAEQMPNLVNHVRAGHPTLIFDDPFPIAMSSGMGITSAPRLPKPQPNHGMGGMFGGGRQPPPPPKADGGMATSLLNALDVQWVYDTVTFDMNNPHPQYDSLPAEYVFSTRDGNPEAFSADSGVSRGLQEILCIYTGTVRKRDTPGRETKFVELLKTSGKSGLLGWNQFTDSNFNPFAGGQTVVPKPPNMLNRVIDGYAHVLAAHITSEQDGDSRNAIFVADVDMISDFFFQSRVTGDLDISLDNVTFVLNAVDVLAGDETYVPLRSRRPKHRTLARLESQKNDFLAEANKREAAADEKADDELTERQDQLRKRVEEIRANENLDPIAKQQMIDAAEQAESQRLSLAEAQIEQDKNREIKKIRAETNRKTRSVEIQTQIAAIFLSPLPAILLGLLVMGKRLSDEKRIVVDSRRRN
ncbi:MAG: Gldg family protein [Fuerstiella sp.]|nr:Gldg family protein [Fuerstiella sp.]